MGLRILHDGDNAAMYCSTSDVAFGPVFSSDKEHDAEERAQSFIRFLSVDARILSDSELQIKYSEWLKQEDAQWKSEEKENE